MIKRWLTGHLQVESVTVAIPGLQPAHQGTKLVQLSDFHFGDGHLSETLLRQAIAAANAVMADAVVLTGDYVTKDVQHVYPLAEHLQDLKSRLGTYAVLGNHDHRFPRAQSTILKGLRQSGIEVLWDRIVYPWGAGLALVGLSDYYSPSFNPQPVMAQLPPEVPRVVLSHNPDTAQILQRWRVDLQLSGHTHGGQIIVPGYGPLLPRVKPLLRLMTLPCRRLKRSIGWPGSQAHPGHQTFCHWEWAQGLHQIKNNFLYVNRGLGTHPPGRLFCPPEMTIITLTGA